MKVSEIYKYQEGWRFVARTSFGISMFNIHSNEYVLWSDSLVYKLLPSNK